MARPISYRPQKPLPDMSKVPGVALVQKDFWLPPKGVDYLTPPFEIEKAYSPALLTLWLDRGKLRSRYGTSDIGTGVADLVTMVNFIDSNGISWLIRFTTTKLQRWDGSTWNDVYSGFTGGVNDQFVYTAFNNKLIFSNGIDGMFEYDFNLGTATVIEGAPSCFGLTTFDGRVIASDVVKVGQRYPARIEWSVKNNELIWGDSTGYTNAEKLGSGFEDLLSTPGGEIDQQRGVWPVTDTIALILRSTSVWQATVTGNFDAPFRFDRLYGKLGTDSRFSFDVVPGGIVGLFSDDIYVISQNGIQAIGSRIKDTILADLADKSTCTGMYDPDTKNYWLVTDNNVYRYSFQDQGWTSHQYPFGIRRIVHTKSSQQGIEIDQLVGTIDSQVGSIDSLVTDNEILGNFFVTDGATGYVVQEDSSVVVDSDGAGGTTDSPIQIATPELNFGSPLNRNEVIYVEMLYEMAVDQTILIQYSLDGMATWSTYESLNLVAATRPAPAVFRKTQESRLIQLRLSSTTLGRFQLLALFVYGQEGAPVNL